MNTHRKIDPCMRNYSVILFITILLFACQVEESETHKENRQKKSAIKMTEIHHQMDGSITTIKPYMD